MTSSNVIEASIENQTTATKPSPNSIEVSNVNQIAAYKPSSAVVVRSAYKQYGRTAILKDLNLTIPDGKM